MKRGIFGLGLLLLFLILGLWGSHAMGDLHKPVSQRLEQAAQTALGGDLQQAVQEAKDAQTQWENHWNRVAALADHSPMDEIDAMFARLEIYAKTESVSDFAACANQLATMISATAEAHALSWRNLL